MNARLLLVEDDPGMVRGLVYNLEAEGYVVDVAGDGDAGLRRIREGGFDLVLLDVMLPKKSGFDVLKRLRADGNRTPVLLLTARATEIDKIAGFKLGADDYVTKPFSLGELLARIGARLRDRSPELRIDLLAMRARRGTREARLTPTEAQILRYLVERAGDAVERGVILQDLWGVSHAAETRTLDNHIARLRRKIESDPTNPQVLVTVPGVGYRIMPGTCTLRDRDGTTAPQDVE